MKSKELSSLLTAAVALLALSPAAVARDEKNAAVESRQENRLDRADLSAEMREAQTILKEFLEDPNGLPREILDEAEAVIIFPHVVRAGFIVTGQYAHGVALAKNASGGWSAPAFFRMSGVGVGLQIGGEAGDMLCVIRDRNGIDALLKNEFTMGVDAAASAGPVGRDVKAGGNTKAGSILTHARTKGLFAGVSLDGAVIKQDTAANAVYYGHDVSARQILIDRTVGVPSDAKALTQTLGVHAR